MREIRTKYSPAFFAFFVVISFPLLINIAACSKPANTTGNSGTIDNPPNDPIINDGTGVIYYDYYSLNNLYLFATAFETERVCFDMNKRTLRWKKRNEFPVPYYFPMVGETPEFQPYSKAFLQSNAIVKIFPSSDVISGGVNGIYFQKIDTATGESLLSKKIIDASELNLSSVFTISEVVTDGSNFYFSCNNGFVYCFDNSGNMVWKKGTYTQHSLVAGKSAFLYLNQGRLYFYSSFGVGTPLHLICLEASSGNSVWTTLALSNTTGRETAFTKDHIINFGDPNGGKIFIIRKLDGQKVGEIADPPASQARVIIPFGAINDNTVAYSDREGKIRHLDVLSANIVATINGATDAFTHFSQFYNGNVYNVYGKASGISLCCANPITGMVWAKDMQIGASQNPQFFKTRLSVANNKLYVVSFGRLENNFWLTNAPVGEKLQFSVTIFDAGSGSFLKQYNNLPGGIAAKNVMSIYESHHLYLFNVMLTN